MVSSSHYDLDKVRKLARDGKIILSKTAKRDTRNLGYNTRDVLDVIIMLKKDDFKETKTYSGEKFEQVCDVYKIDILTGNEDDHDEAKDDLYIKFSMVGEYINIDLLSFHLNR